MSTLQETKEALNQSLTKEPRTLCTVRQDLQVQLYHAFIKVWTKIQSRIYSTIILYKTLLETVTKRLKFTLHLCYLINVTKDIVFMCTILCVCVCIVSRKHSFLLYIYVTIYCLLFNPCSLWGWCRKDTASRWIENIDQFP